MQQEFSGDSKRIAKNTLYLYFRTFFVMAVTIFTSRVILDVLGVEDFGIYNVVGGFVSFFAVLSGTLTAASQRFFSFELGKSDPHLNRVFSTAVSIHICLAIILFFLMETVGVWFLNSKMNINPSRLYAANWVFQCSVFTFCVNLISIPYNAAIIAHERMSAFAYISIFEVLAKLCLVYILYFIRIDSLILYAILMLLVALSLRIIYTFYCRRNFEECHYIFFVDRDILKNMLGFSGWNFFGSTAGILNTQGINLLINIFFGVTFNAARGVATQVDAAINSFVSNFMTALNPQITKSYASENYEYLNLLIVRGTKFAFCLFFLVALPFFLNIEYILQIWLTKVPCQAATFVRLAIVYTLFQTLSQCLYISMLATGNIKKYQIIVGSLSIMAFPLAFLFFKFGLPASFGYIASIIMSLICLLARIFLLKEMIPNFSIIGFISKVICRLFVTVCPIIFIVFLAYKCYLISDGLVGLLISSLLSIVITLISIYLIGFTKEEKDILNNIVKKHLFKK